ncbi:hypothetical protein [Mycolicibacterium hodleri]|uniref:Phage major capsid protein n=1 Tax=Mycolicibacterium hodleri TaxID=49897 RepID=A0A502E258_9MYCO|nr:hypothetical protein [Mycolicibacterium hodleri]TPG31663.1 hypothetical protein EAH80_22170 [Mycolicibacterium hodleri]
MSARTDVDALAELSADERNERIRAAAERVENRTNRALVENRDLSTRENELSNADRAELEALRSAEAVAEHSERMRGAITSAMETRSRPGDADALNTFALSLTRGVPCRVQVETRSVTTANAGARHAVAAGPLGRPEWLYRSARIPFSPADSLVVSGPKFAALVAQTATAELGTKPNMTDPTLATSTLAAFAVLEEVSDQMVRFGAGAEAVTNRLAAESVFSVNAAIADALEAAAGTPVTYTTSPSHMADMGIAKVWAKTGAKPTAIVVNSADYPLLSAKAAVGPGDGIGAEVVAFNGIPLVVNDAITAGVGVVVNGMAFSAHGTDVLLASLPNLDNNTVKLRAETYFALLQHDAGAIVAVDFAA